MRISDWSSDVCSSDLHRPSRRAPRKAGMMTLETPTSGGRRPILRLRGWQDEPNGENERTSEGISAGPPRLRLKKSRSNTRKRIVSSEDKKEAHGQQNGKASGRETGGKYEKHRG